MNPTHCPCCGRPYVLTACHMKLTAEGEDIMFSYVCEGEELTPDDEEE